MLKKFFRWIKSLFVHESRSFVYNVPYVPVKDVDVQFKCTKAYADQRQKMAHNRRRKPSKAMRNLYQL